MDSTSTSEAEAAGAPAASPQGARAARLRAATDAVAAADPITRPRHAVAWLSLVPPLLRGTGLDRLYDEAPRFARAGFAGTPWGDPARLRPRLWAGDFDAEPPYPWWETVSTLRMLAVALGDAAHEDVSAADARRFLERVLSLNLDKLIDAGTEASRSHRVRHHAAASAVLRYVLHRLPRPDFLRDVAEEVEAIMAQRPVWTHTVRETLRLVSTAPGADDAGHPGLDRYVEAALGPTPASMRFRDATAYDDALADADDATLDAEADGMAASLRGTGIACAQHAALLRRVADDEDRLARALGLDDRGRAVLAEHHALVADLVRQTITPNTAQTAYGIARVLERGLLDRPEVAAALPRLAELDVEGNLEDVLLGSADAGGGLTGTQVLLGGVLRVLGQPLGVGQGNNPTCQSARGISLWSQYRPGHLVDLITEAVRTGGVAMDFEGTLLRSDELASGLAPTLDPDLDPVSLVLVPHLDRLYDAMMRLAAWRGEDGHKWVNPALYGRIVPPGYSSCFDPVTWQVRDHGGFVARFHAAFHPAHNSGHAPLYATPVGITVTDAHGKLLGLHAVSLQRVDAEPGPGGDGVIRAYFYNPNNEGRQNWGGDVVPSVRDHGEVEGESSLPFDQFASRLYAFHHPIHLPGESADVPRDVVEPVTDMARRTWGRSYAWP